MPFVQRWPGSPKSINSRFSGVRSAVPSAGHRAPADRDCPPRALNCCSGRWRTPQSGHHRHRRRQSRVPASGPPGTLFARVRGCQPALACTEATACRAGYYRRNRRRLPVGIEVSLGEEVPHAVAIARLGRVRLIPRSPCPGRTPEHRLANDWAARGCAQQAGHMDYRQWVSTRFSFPMSLISSAYPAEHLRG